MTKPLLDSRHMKKSADQIFKELLNNPIGEFFYKFSRYEYALKVSGFLKPQKKADPNWCAFAKELTKQDCSFWKTFKKETNFYPAKQIVNSNKLTFGKRKNVSNNCELFLAVSCVRNNLFHGAKLHNSPEKDAERDMALINWAIEVLDGCYKKLEELAKEKGKNNSCVLSKVYDSLKLDADYKTK